MKNPLLIVKTYDINSVKNLLNDMDGYFITLINCELS